MDVALIYALDLVVRNKLTKGFDNDAYGRPLRRNYHHTCGPEFLSRILSHYWVLC